MARNCYTVAVTDLGKLLDVLPTPAAVVDANGVVVLANWRLSAAVGMRRGGLNGRKLASIYPETADQRTVQFFVTRVARGERDSVEGEEFHLPGPSGERVPVLVSVAPLSGESEPGGPGPHGAVMMSFADVTRLKEAEASLREHFTYVAQLSDTALEQALALKRRSTQAEEEAEQLRSNEVVLRSQAEDLQDRAEELRDHAVELETVNRELERRVAQRTAEIRQANLDAIYMLAVASEAKDQDTGSHVRRIRGLAEATAKAMGIAEAEAYDIGLAAVLHDVGKIHVPDAILTKPGPLTPDERGVMQQHTLWGQRILPDRPFFRRSRAIARSHHENHNGSGYPDSLAGEDIPVEARIVHVADVYDALISPRPYKDAWPAERAIAELSENSGGMFDPKVVEAFQRAILKYRAAD